MIRYIPVSLSLVAAAVSGVLYAAPINTPVLATMDNFRDIAGTTSVYTTSHDGTLRTGVFIVLMLWHYPPRTRRR